MSARLCLVVAMAQNRVIGKNGGLPWRLPADLRQFKAITMGKPMIMGRKTFDSIGRPLPGRTNIVVTRKADYAAEGVVIVGDMTEALKVAQEIASADGTGEIAAIGGGEIYAMALPLADRVYLTEVQIDVDGDVKFPPFAREDWSERERISHLAEGDRPGYDFVVLDRRVPAN